MIIFRAKANQTIKQGWIQATATLASAVVDLFNIARASCLVSVFVSLSRSLATKFLHLRSTKNKSRTWDPVGPLMFPSKYINYKSIFFLITIVTHGTQYLKGNNMAQIKFHNGGYYAHAQTSNAYNFCF